MKKAIVKKSSQNKTSKKEDSFSIKQKSEIKKIVHEVVDKRFESIDKRFESIDKRFESIDKRFESIDKRFDAIDKKFEDQTNTILNTLEQMQRTMDRIEINNQKKDDEHKAFFVDGIKYSKNRIDDLEKRVSVLEEKTF